MPVACAWCLLYVRVCLLCFVSYYRVITFQRAEGYLGREKKAEDERNRRASIILPISPLKMAKIITTVPGSMCRNALGVGWIGRTPGIVARVFSKLVCAETKD